MHEYASFAESEAQAQLDILTAGIQQARDSLSQSVEIEQKTDGKRTVSIVCVKALLLLFIT